MLTAFQTTTFLTSAAKLEQCPVDTGVEIAFLGRSNAGKSSVLNTLCRQKKLARTSKDPGRTRLLNFFACDDAQQKRLVDLPGYGYARVSHAMRHEWELLISAYLSERKSLHSVVLVMDIRHPMQPFDWQILHWALDANIHLHLLLTKADKITRGAAANTLLQVLKPYAHHPLISAQVFSSLKKQGVEELMRQLKRVLYTA